MTRRFTVLTFVCLASLLTSATAHADLFNHRNHLVGVRASLMGGAFTAIADDYSAAFYNPAGLADVRGLVLSFSVTGYSYLRYQMKQYFGESVAPFDIDMNRFNPIPTTFGVSYSVKRDRWVIALGLIQLDSVRFAALNTFQASVQTTDGTFALANLSFKTNVDASTYWIGISTAVRATKWLSLGLSVFYQLYQGVIDTRANLSIANGQTVIEETENDLLAGGLVFVVGVKARLWRHLYLGLTYSSQTLPLHAKNKWAYDVQGDALPKESLAGQTKTDTRLPHRLVLGIAWSDPARFTLSADLIAYLPLRYSAPNHPMNPLDANFRYQELFHVDASIGAEIRIAAKWALNLGFYTNTSAAPDQNKEMRVHVFGGTLGIGWGKPGHQLTFGVNVFGGRSGRQSIPGDDDGIAWRRFGVQVMFGGATTIVK